MEEFKQLLHIIGFSLVDGKRNIWNKKYSAHDNYKIEVRLGNTLSTSIIDFGNKINFDRSTSSNLSDRENEVILECVNRLLEKGYKPSSITLEKKWPLGHKEKGYLDILIKNNTGHSFLMIECKTFGQEHKKERQKMQTNGGQLFSYFVQEKTTKYLALYSSQVSNDVIEYKNDIIVVTDSIKNATNQQDAFEAWNPQVFEKKGIFEAEANAYNVVFLGIQKKDLLPLTDGDDIFNGFAEVLRRNVVSDKTNAFNKIFNLFLCKIVDEFETQDAEITKFQWQEGEDSETVMLRLNDLYKRGMEKYLNLKISAVTLQELELQLANVNTTQSKEAIKNLFIQQKLYTGNEFAFIEVFDKETFQDNSIIVKEVVKLLENYRIKYSTKQQFLGDFFEKLLNTGIKQESGQFFTPIPIARFICKSIPIESIIEAKNKQREERILPYCIDYASGSGHFLTEIMGEINKYVLKIEDKDILGGERAKSRFNAEKNSYLWAQEYIYGIEKDYRLAKTTKISTFLNGDGDANIICGDGLDNFVKSQDYKGKLKISTDGINNEQFDILVANPPYSVSGFKTTLGYGKSSFDLYDSLTDQSSEIEALFIERTKQLLKKGGSAGIILPISILSNAQIHRKAREIILKNFEIKGIVELGKNTFMATNTKTVILFLKKRDHQLIDSFEELIRSYFSTFTDFDCNQVEKVVKNYVGSTYNGYTINDYVNFFQGQNSNIKNCETFQEYITTFGDVTKADILKKIIEIEKEKILYFIISFQQKVILVESGEKTNEKDFLGYEFSNRRGHEGIRIYNSTKLYNDDDLQDLTKVNSYILKNFLNKPVGEIDDSLKSNIQIVNLSDLIDFTGINFEKQISSNFYKKKILMNYQIPSDKLENFLSTLETGSRPSGGVARIREGIPSLGGEHIGYDGSVDLTSMKYVSEDFYIRSTTGHILKEDILICKDGAQTGKVAFVNGDFPYSRAMINEHLYILRANDKILQKYLFYFLFSYLGQALLKVSVTGQAQGGLNRPNLNDIRIPIVEKSIQKKTLKKILPLEIKRAEYKRLIDATEKDIIKFIKSKPGKNKARLSKYITLEYGSALPDRDRRPGEYVVVGANGAIGYHEKSLILGPAIIVGRKGSVGKINWFNNPCYPIDTTFWVRINNDSINFRYCYYLLKSLELDKLNDGMGPGGLNRNVAYALNVSLPSIPEQLEIIKKADELENIEHKLISKSEEAKKQIFNFIMEDMQYTFPDIIGFSNNS